jgi:hypothetical protein
MHTKYVATHPVVVDAVQWTGANRADVEALTGGPYPELEIGDWIVRSGEEVEVLSDAEFVRIYTPSPDATVPAAVEPPVGADAVADAFAMEGGFD